MVHKIINKLIVLVLCAVAFSAWGQQATTGLPAPTLSGTGAPSASCTSGSSYMGLLYIQTDATNGHIWICDQESGSWAWTQQLSAVKNVVTGSTITAGSFVLGGCTAVSVVTVAGAVVGTNSAVASPIFASAPTGNIGLFNVTAWVSAANTVSVQGCAVGILSAVPNFQPRIFLY